MTLGFSHNAMHFIKIDFTLEMIFSKLASELFPSIRPSVEYLAEEVPVPIPSADSELELRCVVAVMRHGDRTPKQKMKMVVTQGRFLQLFDKYNVKKKKVIKLKSPGELQEVLDIARDLLEEIETNPLAFGDSTELERKLKQTKAVLEMYGHFSGINRKVQFKSIKPPDVSHEKALLMILKWGGELTPAGTQQAEELGKAFRCIYPGGAGEYGSLPGSGFLRLHSTYRHDLKVYASDEGRVQMTAAAFVKGLLDLEGSLAPVLFHLVKRDVNKLLDNAFVAEEAMAKVKQRLHEYMRTDTDTAEELSKKLNPTGAASNKVALDAIKNPVNACQQLYEKIEILIERISELEAASKEENLYLSESWKLMHARWAKLEKDFKHKDSKFDISKIPDIYDCIKYDMLHNSHLDLKVAHDLYIQSMHLADLVMPQEYGITREEKLEIAELICCPLLGKIQTDISNTVANTGTDIMHQLDPKYSSGVVTPRRHVRTRVYFTSESNIHAMFNILRYGALSDLNDPDWKNAKQLLDGTAELNYMTQFVFLLFENCRVPVESKERYKIEIHFSPGAKDREEINTSGESAGKRILDSKKNNIRLKRMLPIVHDDVVSENLSLSYMPSGNVQKQTSRSLPALMSKEELNMLRNKAAHHSIFDEEEESQSGDKPTSLQIDNESQTVSDNVTIKELSGIDLASSVKPLQRLCTVSLGEIQHFLSYRKFRCDQELLQQQRTSGDSISINCVNLASS